MNNMNNELLEAINAVLHVNYKYQAKEAFKTVEAAGYKVCKEDGLWSIINPKTHKRIYLCQYRHRKYGEAITLSSYRCRQADYKKVDILNFLNKPINTENNEVEYCPSWSKVSDLRWDKFWLREKERALEELEKKLSSARKEYGKALEKLVKTRARLGLLK